MPPKKKKGGKSKKGSKSSDSKKGYVEEIVLPPLVSEKTSTLIYSVVTSDIPTVSRLVSSYNYMPSLQDVDLNGSTPLHLGIIIIIILTL